MHKCTCSISNNRFQSFVIVNLCWQKNNNNKNYCLCAIYQLWT